MFIHVVQRGDTLWRLAQQYNTSTSAIAAANGIQESGILVPGQSLLIPISADQHVVRQGDSLWSIANQYGTTPETLASLNGITYPFYIYPGQRLRIPVPAKPTIEVNAYTEQFNDAGVREVTEIGSLLTYLSPFSYHVAIDGSLSGPDDAAILEASRAQHILPMMVLSNFKDGTFDSDIAHAVLTNMTVQTKVINNTMDTLRQKGYKAVNIDFEYIPQTDREAYNAFLRRLKERLAPGGYLLSTCLAPKSSADQKGRLYEAHDYSAHGDIADFVILMTYEWGWSGGPPRAVAPIDEVEKVVRYALSVMPASKIMLGMPLYGYDWTLPYVQGNKWAPTISNADAIKRAAQYGAEIRFDGPSQSPFFRYYDNNGVQHEVWFEDARSVQAKFNLVKSLKLRGVSYWVLGTPFRQNWELLRANFTVKKLV
ncbi:spore germination protein [Paenibacillus cellulosilyticus]|uniref:Spore germination protein n=1 Tax=Paenibacillus cellulosilyticus TaxID=375489 RepID=A0A2V2YPM8_9BACL|nr:LysM peptidoglycan-binding domain-containing protein [Paenibacillus cellulosilyticus]PWV95327.1 spore germination protein [Paenibacillus cellulosilyticus]QKS44060.1 LysM peptidoglycan-binding domain-containing protein [Paenibacillus cellulosilyticus]